MAGNDFLHEPGLIYLNHAAVAPWPQRTADAVREFAIQNTHRGARDYSRWLQVEQRLRQRLAWLLNAPSTDDIALIKNTSEGLSFVAYGLDWQPGDAVIINNHEFPSNRIVWQSLTERYGVEVRDVDLDQGPDPEAALIAAMDERVRLLAVSSVQYGSGLRMNLERLGTACRERDILFCVDAIQTLGALRLDVQTLGPDFVIADGHKWMLGPEGLGVFYSRPQARDRLRLTELGWHSLENVGDFDATDWRIASSARRFECGSPNMLGIFALDASLSLLQDIGLDTVETRILANARRLIDAIRQQPQLELLSAGDHGRHAGIVTFRVTGRDSRQLYRQLMHSGVICANRGGGIRYSPHYYNTPEQLDRALAQVLQLSLPR